jgi:hypothetical protein
MMVYGNMLLIYFRSYYFQKEMESYYEFDVYYSEKPPETKFKPVIGEFIFKVYLKIKHGLNHLFTEKKIRLNKLKLKLN